MESWTEAPSVTTLEFSPGPVTVSVGSSEKWLTGVLSPLWASVSPFDQRAREALPMHGQ